MIKEREHVKSCQLSQASLTYRILLLNFTLSDFTLHWSLCNKDQHFTWSLDFKTSICFWPILKAFLLLLIQHLCLLHTPSCSISSTLLIPQGLQEFCLYFTGHLAFEALEKESGCQISCSGKQEQIFHHIPVLRTATFQALAFHPHYLFI